MKLVQWGWAYKRYHHNNWAKYKLSADDWEALWFQQGGCCAICKTAFAHPVQRDMNKQGVKCYMDHKHFAGEQVHTSTAKEVRGLLCFNCNTFLGVVQENLLFLEGSVAYLKKHGVSTFDQEMPEHAKPALKKYYEITCEDEDGQPITQLVEYT